MIGDPGTARPRPDLTFLRRRARPKQRSTPVEGAAGIDYTHHDPAKAATTARPKIDFSRPDRSAPARSAPARSAPARSAPARSAPAPAAPAPASVDPLDLSGAPEPSARRERPTRASLRTHRDRRIGANQQQVLDVLSPTITLSRVQSGVGQLSIEAVCSDAIGDLRLGAVYQLRSGGTSTVQHSGGNRFAPSSRRPVLIASRAEYEELDVDLRQLGDIERLAVYAFSESRTELNWGGTLVITTFGGARIDVPMDTLYPSRVAVLVSLYNLNGEIVIRAEVESIVGDVREAARAYGYDRITWRDERNPVD